MIDLSCSPAFVNKKIPINKMFTDEIIERYGVKSITWVMSIKPQILNVTPLLNEKYRIEEIEVFQVSITKLIDEGTYTELYKHIFAKVLYPCVLIIVYKNKYKFVACKFEAGKNDYNKNVLKSFYISSWIYDDLLTEKAAKCKDAISRMLLTREGSLQEIYLEICNTILQFQQRYIGSRNHIQRIVYSLAGNSGIPIIATIPSVKRYEAKAKKNKYQKTEYMSQFKYYYEYEDIWHTFMQDDRLNLIIKKRRYSDIEDLIFSIDSRYDDNA